LVAIFILLCEIGTKTGDKRDIPFLEIGERSLCPNCFSKRVSVRLRETVEQNAQTVEVVEMAIRHPRGLFRPILAVHWVLLSTSEQGTFNIGRSTTTNPLDERIDQYQGIVWT
jgi:hypothetical protein